MNITRPIQISLLAGLFCLPLLGLAQAPTSSDQIERDRIARERIEVGLKHEKDLKACQGKFAVTDCEQAAHRGRRKAMDDLRRQELVLNEKQRKVKAGKQQAKLDERARNRAAQDPSKTAFLPSATSAVAAGSEQTRSATLRTPAQEAEQSAQYDKKVAQAQEHRKKVEQAQASRSKPAASALPVPR